MSLIDEARKLLVVREIIDTKHFTGVWRGQAYECRALPDTSSLSVGDSAFCHVLPGNTELVAILRANPQLWFSPGAESPNYRGELWMLTTGNAPTLQLTLGDDQRYFTQLAWSQGVLYAFDFKFAAIGDDTITISSVNRTAKTLTTLATWTGAHPNHSDAVIDVAEFGGMLYTMHNGWAGSQVVRRFDPATNAWSTVYNFTTDGGNGYSGGIAVDPVGNKLVATDGSIAVTSPTGNVGDWTLEYTFTNYYVDNFGLITNRDDDDLVYMGFQGYQAGDAMIMSRNAGVWSNEMVVAVDETGACSFTQEHTGAVAVALYAQQFGYGVADAPVVWRKAAGGGAWGVDWAGPGGDWEGLMNSGLCYHDGQVYSLWSNYYGAATPATRLYVRDAGGTWTLVQEWANYEFLATTPSWVSGMASVPETVRLCHEVG